MIVRRMLCSDAPVVAALERAIFPDAWSEAGISEELKDELYGGYVVCPDPCACGGDAGTGPVGYVLLRVVAGEGEILRVGVLPAFRRRGLARRLLEKTFFNMDKDAAQWFLEVRERNTAAIGLYRSFGFDEIGRRKAYYRDTGEAAVLMRRDSRCAEP
jgi:ribosomal-protein-alanine N-acetyltransferase